MHPTRPWRPSISRRTLAASLASPGLDLAIDVALPINEPVRHRPFLEDEFCVVSSASSRHPETLDVEAYLGSQHVTVTTRSPDPAIEEGHLLNHGVRRRIAVRCLTYQAAINVVAGSDRLVTMPGQLARTLGAGRGLRIHAVPYELPRLKLNLYWHANKEGDPANSWLRDLVGGLRSRLSAPA